MKLSYLLLFICFVLIGLSQSIDSKTNRKFIRNLENDSADKKDAPNDQKKKPKEPKGKEKSEKTSSTNDEKETSGEEAQEKSSSTDKSKEVTKESTQSSPVTTTAPTNLDPLEIDIASIRSQIEKYRLLDNKSYSELCSDKILDKKILKTLHLSNNNFILTLDQYNLTLKFQLNDNSYYPKLSKIPYRCTSYCQNASKNGTTYTTINRFKYNDYLVELLGSKEYGKITFYFENIHYLESESEQDKHLVEALMFTVQRDGCTPPIGNPKIRDIHYENPVTKDLIEIFCDNKEIRNKFIDNEEFVIEDLEEIEPIFKNRNIIFFTYPVISWFSLNANNVSKNDLIKNNLANSVKNITNAVQLIANNSQDKFIVFNDQQMYILEKQATQLVEQTPTYSIQNYYSCPEPLCLDPYFDAIFPIKTCDFHSLFNFLPKGGKLLMAFRGTYFYLISQTDLLKAPKIDQAIPIDYLFKEILNKPDIDFNYVNAGAYVKKSDVLILFKDSQYLLINPSKKIVNGPFNTSDTFRFSRGSPDVAYMDEDYLVIIEGNQYVKYSWKASSLENKRDVSLVEFITLESQSTIDQELGFVLNAAYKDGDVYNLFINDNLIELEFDKNGEKQVRIKDVASQYFSNCAATKKNKENIKKENLSNLDRLYKSIRDRRDMSRQKEYNGTILINDTTLDDSTTPNDNANLTDPKTKNSSSSIDLSYLVQLVGLAMLLFNLSNE